MSATNSSVQYSTEAYCTTLNNTLPRVCDNTFDVITDKSSIRFFLDPCDDHFKKFILLIRLKNKWLKCGSNI